MDKTIITKPGRLLNMVANTVIKSAESICWCTINEHTKSVAMPFFQKKKSDASIYE
jgi:hypothetical protein